MERKTPEKLGFTQGTDGRWTRRRGTMTTELSFAPDGVKVKVTIPLKALGGSVCEVKVLAPDMEEGLAAVQVELGLLAARLEDELRTARGVLQNDINMEEIDVVDCKEVAVEGDLVGIGGPTST